MSVKYQSIFNNIF